MVPLVERFSLFTLLIIIGLRPLIGEVLDSSAQAISVQGVADATPLRTVLLDLAVMGAVLLWLLARAMGASPKSIGSHAQKEQRLQTVATQGGINGVAAYRWTGLEVGWAVMVVAGAISCANAGNKRAAIVAAVNWLMLPVLTIALVNLLRRPWQVRLLMSVIIASCAVQAYQCYDQAGGALADTEAMYLHNKDAFWKAQGVPLDSPTVALFERRLRSREATGFLSHPNVAAAHLLLGGLIALAWAYSRWRSEPHPFRRGFAVLLGLVGLVMLGMIATTGSLGSATAAMVSMAVGGLALWKQRWLQSRRRIAFIGGWGCIGLAVLAVIGHGWYHGRLPTDTLDFRWKYWTASARMISDHPLNGVGPQNYGYRYLQYKTIDSPEEIQNAHNFLVQFAAEWGLPGLVGVVLMLLLGSWFATRRVEQVSVLAPAAGGGEAESSKKTAGGTRPTGKVRTAERVTPDDAFGSRFLTGAGLIPGRPLAWGFGLTAAIMLIRIPMLGSDDPNFILVSTVIPLIIFGVAFAIAAIETNVWDTLIDDDLPFLATGINAGLFAFLLQDTINFALFVPGTAMTFFAALAIPSSILKKSVDPTHVEVRRSWLPFCIATVVIAIWVWAFAGPMFYARGWSIAGRTYSNYVPEFSWEQQGPIVCWSRVAQIDPLDSATPADLGQWCLRTATLSPDPQRAFRDAVQWTEVAIRRNPYSTALYRQLMLIHQAAAKVDPSGDHPRLAVEAGRKVVELYPTSPEAWIALGERLADYGSISNSPPLRSAAADAYQRALELDSARPEWEEIRRLSADQRADIEGRIRYLTTPGAS